jgi:hypothetical protein
MTSKLWFVSALFAVSTCHVTPPNPPPPPVLTGAVYVTITPTMPAAVVHVGPVSCTPVVNTPEKSIALCNPVPVGEYALGFDGIDQTVYELIGGQATVTIVAGQNVDALAAFRFVVPPAPSRMDLLTAQVSFSGLTATTQQYGTCPWFEVQLDTLNSYADRVAIYAMKRAAGDKVIALAVSHAYLEPGIPPCISAGHDWTNDLGGLHGLIDEVIRNGFYVQLHLAGDGGTSHKNADGSWSYNDPVGWTYGCPWLIENLPRIQSALSDQRAYLRMVLGFDGVFYGCSPEQIAALGHIFRANWPDGVLGIEHDPGHIPTGEGDADWVNGGAMQNYDLILSEFNYPDSAGGANDTVWQIAGRLLGPAYVRPADQPAGDDPHPPWYLRQGTPRGPYVTCAFEWWATYAWTRNNTTVAQILQQRAYLRSLGYQCVG